MAINYASKYLNKVDERFTKESQSKLGCSASVDFTGNRTVKVYSIPTVPMNDYDRTAGSNRYGTPVILEDQVQEMTVKKDRSFTFTLDRMDREETEMTHDAGKALARQISEVVKPEIDTYTFGVQAKTPRQTAATYAPLPQSLMHTNCSSRQENISETNLFPTPEELRSAPTHSQTTSCRTRHS